MYIQIISELSCRSTYAHYGTGIDRYSFIREKCSLRGCCSELKEVFDGRICSQNLSYRRYSTQLVWKWNIIKQWLETHDFLLVFAQCYCAIKSALLGDLFAHSLHHFRKHGLKVTDSETASQRERERREEDKYRLTTTSLTSFLHLRRFSELPRAVLQIHSLELL